MPTNPIFIAQSILVITISSFFGDLFSTFVDRHFFGDRAETQNNKQVLEQILATVRQVYI